LKRTPTLTFHYDDSIARGDRITRLLERDDEAGEDR
jgi:ribosome-binding factor A